MNDTMRILEYLQHHHGGLTCKECEKKIGTTELRKRVSELRAKGYRIDGIWEESFNRVGRKTRYMRYFLIQEAKAPKPAPIRKPRAIDFIRGLFWDKD